jgi:peptidoglycan/xylan/chitin deacetylase (PgdA/CDA1 family)
VSILAYHGVIKDALDFEDWCFLDQGRFRDQVRYLTRFFDVVHFGEAVRRLRANKVTSPTAVITFDDGFQNVFTSAFPVLQEYDTPATIFMVTNLIGTGRTVWFARLLRALARTRFSEFEWDGEHFNLRDAKEKQACSNRLQTVLKALRPDRLEQALRAVEAQLDVEPDQQEPEGSPFRMLSTDEVRMMFDSGLVEFGGHTADHTIFSRLTREQKSAQIQSSVVAVEKLVGSPCRYFAYPNGCRGDYDEETVELLRMHGIDAAVTMEPGANERGTPLLELHRYGIGADTSMARFKLMVHNIR